MSFVGDIEGPCGPALTITLSWTEVESDLDLYVTEPGGEVVRFANMVGVSAYLNGACLRHVRIL